MGVATKATREATPVTQGSEVNTGSTAGKLRTQWWSVSGTHTSIVQNCLSSLVQGKEMKDHGVELNDIRLILKCFGWLLRSLLPMTISDIPIAI